MPVIHRGECRNCGKQYVGVGKFYCSIKCRMEYDAKHKKTRKQINADYRHKNHSKIIEGRRKFRENHREELREYYTEYRAKNRKRIRKLQAKWHKEHYIKKPITYKNVKSRSAVAKGKRYENFLLELFRDTLDKNTYKTPGSGSGEQKNDLIVPKFNLEIEAKNRNRVSIAEDWKQVERQRTDYNHTVLIIRDPTKKEFERSFVVMNLNDFIILLSKGVDNIEVRAELPDDLKWKVKKMKDTTNEVLKVLNKYD